MKVQYFSFDISKTFIDLARIYFPNAKIVSDRYHFVRQVYWALENVRKRIQKRMLPSLRKYYKRSRNLITKRKARLSNDNREALEWMLEYSEDLRKAHFIKELFVDILDENSKIMLFTANINADNHCCFFYLLNLLILCRIHL